MRTCHTGVDVVGGDEDPLDVLGDLSMPCTDAVLGDERHQVAAVEALLERRGPQRAD